MTAKDIEAIIEQNSIERNNISLLNYSDAVRIIKLCEENNVKVMGIDAFRISDDKIRPCMENSADFTSESGIYTSALEFIGKINPDDFWFEITI